MTSIYPIYDEQGQVARMAIYVRDITESKRAARIIEENEARLQEAQQIAKLGSWELDLQTYELKWSDENYRIFGLQPQEIQPSYEAFLETIHPDDREAVDRAYMESVANHTPYEIIERVLLKDGTIKYVLEQCRTSYDEQGRPLRSLGTVQDITERVEAEKRLMEEKEKLRLANERFEQLAGNIEEMFWVRDHEHREAGYISPAFEKIFGISRDDPQIHTRVNQGIFPEDVPVVKKARLDEAAGISTQLEYRYILPDGTLRWVWERSSPVKNEQGKLRRTVGVTSDITAAKQAQMHLKDRESFLQSIVSSSPGEILVINLDGYFTYSNRRWEGQPDEVFHRTRFVDDVHPEHAGLATSLLSQAIQSKQIQRAELRVLVRTGAYHWWEVVFSPVIVDGQVERLTIFTYDINERKEAELALAASEERYRLLSEELEQRVEERTAEVQDLYDYAPTGYHTVAVDGTFTMMNQTELKWLGYTREEVVGKKNLSDLVSPEGMRAIDESLPAFLEQGYFNNLEYDMVRKDGSLLPVVSNTLAFYEPDGTYSHSRWTVFDNTERKKAQDALRQSEETYRALFENSNDGIYMLSTEGIPLLENQQALNLIGYSREEYDRLDPAQKKAIVPEDLPLNQVDYFSAVLRGEKVPLHERIFIGKGGRKINVEINLSPIRDASGKIMLVQSVVRDITQRKAIEAEIRRINNLSDSALELAKAGYWYIPLDGSGTYTSSDRVIALYGARHHADYRYSIQQDWLKNIQRANPEAADRIEKALAALMEGRSEQCNVEYEFKRPRDGRVVWMHSIGSIVKDSHGRRVGISGMSRDITQQKRMEQELSTAKDAAEAANRAKSVFLANMSHEIRTPMNAILGFTQIVLKDQRLDESNRKYLEIINRSGEHLLTLINEILEMSKIEAGHVTLNPSAFSLPALLQDIQVMFHPRVEAKDLSMTLSLDPGLCEYITTDENKLKEILINLLGNAVKFTQKGGITLRCRTEKEPASEDPKDLLLMLDVEDTGVGIAPQDISKLFKAFEQTRSGAQLIGGTGLGLAISQSHARLLGGEITVTSTPGVGSCFHVRVSVQASKKVELVEEAPRRQAVGLKPGTRDIKVLIVDDHEENRLVLKGFLEPVGISTRPARNGVEAIEIAESWRPDVILMDLRMPVMGGFEAGKHIRAADFGKDMHIIAVTASILDLDRQKVEQSGMTGFIRKPFKDYELFAALENHLGDIFIYLEPDRAQKLPAETINARLTSEALSLIPPDLVERMRFATANALFDELMTLIDELSAYSQPLAHKLRSLANEYQYDALLKLFEDG